MKKTALVMISAIMAVTATPLFGADTPQDQYICKLEARKCMTQMDVVQEKMKKMNEGIQKGTTYSEGDMKKLQSKIKELNDLLDKIKPVTK